MATAWAMGIILGLGGLFALRLFATPLALFIFGITIAAALSPLVKLLERWLPRTLAIILIYILLIALLVGAGWIIVPALVAQANQATDHLPQLVDQVRNFFSQWNQVNPQTLLNNLGSRLGSAVSGLVSLPLKISSSLFDLVLIFFVSLYSLIETPRITRFLESLVPSKSQSALLDLLNGMSNAMGGYIRGIVINGLVVGVLVYLGLLIIGVDYPLVLGLLAGLLEMIPVLGPIISVVPIGLVALLNSPTQALIALGYLILMQQIENHILVPNIMRGQTEMLPLLTILALFAGGTIGGLLGALVAIPIAAALQVLVQRVIAPAIRRRTGAAAAISETD